MSHSVNMALERLISTGIPVSLSVMFPTPWYQERVEMLKRHPDVSVGVHLTRNSEWKSYRWGPVLGRSLVPTLVDADGYFFPTSETLHSNPRSSASSARRSSARSAPGSRSTTSELGVLVDTNPDGGLPAMSKNREGELEAVTSSRFRDGVRARNVKLITYRQLIEMQGLKSMRRPGEG